MSYNPFNKPIHELTPGDLDKLIEDEVAEGYWVEYKRQFLAKTSVAHSTASFANSYGGWYFVGVKADPTTNIATDICGFDLASCPDPISHVRDIIGSHIDPIPIAHPKLIELDSGAVVLVVQIPGNQETPFITRDGRIYRRVGSSSQPVAENDRYALDRLVDQGREIERRFEEFCRDERTFCKAERDQGWVNIYVSPYPLGTVSKREMFSSEGVERLLLASQKPITTQIGDMATIEMNVPFGSGQVSVGSVILRQVKQARLAFNSLTAEFFYDGRAKFHIPLEYIPDLSFGDTSALTSRSAKGILGKILDEDEDHDISLLRFFDINRLGYVVVGFMGFYREWLGNDEWIPSLRATVSMEGVWRSVPFCDDDKWAEYVTQFGLSVLGTDSISIPRYRGRGLMLDRNGDLPPCATICSVIGMGFGLPGALSWDLMMSPFRSDG